MPEYNYLTHNESNFPHIKNVDVYKFDNDFDYGRFDYTQMILQICTVPWDMGEAHIGNRTISGIGNVVYFGSKDERDEWFNNIPESECYRFTTKFKELHRSLQVDVPIPYDMCAKHNYLRVEYAKFANEDSPVQFEGADGLNEWFWFIREVEFLAPNTTRLHLLPDAFQTWIYDVTINGMVLERGHAPMFAMRTDEYLQNPLDNNTYLLTDDVNFGEASQVKHIDTHVFNAGDMYACIATTGNMRGNWDNKTPASAYYQQNGVPSVYVFALETSELSGFLNTVNTYEPQFAQTVQAVFFVAKNLVTVLSSFNFRGYTLRELTSTRKSINFVDLEKSMFGYDAKYADMAKLYTEPYAHIEITDENGDTDIIKIEDTDGKISISAQLTLAYPFLNIEAHLMGVGGNASKTVSFKNVNTYNMPIAGKWYDTLHSWNIPTFAITQDASDEYEYSARWDRQQARNDYNTAWNNAYLSANTITANAGLQASANSAKVATSNSYMTSETSTVNALDGVKNQSINQNNIGSALSTIAANEMQGALSATQTAASGVAGVATSALSGNPLGAVSAGVNALIGSASTLASVAISNGLTQTQVSYSNAANNVSATATHSTNTTKTQYACDTQTDIAAIENALTTGTAANTAATQKANADRIAYNAEDAVINGIRQAALNAPFMYGNFANGETATTKPQCLFAHVVTQTKSAISSAGDEFARYGYMFEKQWNFSGDWNIGKYFTYWKLKDFWVSNLNVPDMYMDRLRFFLFGGVTVWRKPEYIGHIDIYDNFN